MRLHLIAVGNRMPDWVDVGYAEYAKRLPADCALVLHEIAPGKRTKGADLERARREEGEKMLAALPKGAYVVALEVGGRAWTTQDLAQRLTEWRQGGVTWPCWWAAPRDWPRPAAPAPTRSGRCRG